MKYVIALLALLVPLTAFAQPRVASVYVGANGIWYDENARPSDFEAGGTGAASLSPHISAVGGVFYGFSHSYLRGSIGARITTTDVDNPNLSMGLGIQYQASSEPRIRPQEWGPDASVGYRPWPDKFPRVVVGAQASYGLTSKQAYLTAAVRYKLNVF